MFSYERENERQKEREKKRKSEKDTDRETARQRVLVYTETGLWYGCWPAWVE